MFLLERIVGVGTYCIVLLAFCLLVGYSKFRLKTLFWVYTILLAVIAYLYLPYKTADLYRIYEYLELFGKYSFHDFFRIYVVSVSAPVGRIYYWLIAKTGLPHLLPAITALISYGIIFYIMGDCAERFRVNRSTTALILFFYMSMGHYMYTISNIRTMLSVALIALCFYVETKHKRFYPAFLILYAIAILMHNLAVVFLLIRVAAILFSRKSSVYVRIFAVIVLIGAGVAMQLLVPDFTDSLVDKAMIYVSGGRYSYTWDYILSGLIVVVLLYFLYIYYKTKVENTLTLHTQNSAMILALMMSIAFVGVFTFFYRIVTSIVAVLCIPMIMELLSDPIALRYSRKLGFPLKGVTLIVGVIELALSCTRGSLCGMKFFELGI